VSLLLDTHALLWWLGDTELTDLARQEIADPSNLVAVSAASIWEISIKASLGKLKIDVPVAPQVATGRFESLPISLDHAERAGGLPHQHRDPIDRMLVAQAQIEGLTIVTRDGAFESYDVTTMAC
jgi:PIN domain nuclease of toxin-antitoxin system